MRPPLTRYAWLSVAAAALTFLLKIAASYVSGSVGLLSDALEAIVNLAAATVALAILRIVARPPDETHPYGHDKAEYFSSGIEGTLIVIAAASILYAGVKSLLNPRPLQQLGLGLALAIMAALINLIVGQYLKRTGKRNDSITLEANGRHLITDVWTSVGVVIGVSLAALTGRQWLDPLVAIIIGVKIGWEGLLIFRRSVSGLMDTPIVPEENEAVIKILEKEREEGDIRWHALRTRQSGSRRFIDVHVLVPGKWSVQRSHDLAERLEAQIGEEVRYSTVLIHVEPLEDERSWQDLTLDGRDMPVEL